MEYGKFIIEALGQTRASMLQKLEKYLFYIFLFSIPFQMRKILWYSGWRFNEWQSISVYFTDLLFAALFLFWCFNLFPKLSNDVLRIKYYGNELKTVIHNTKFIIRNSSFYLITFLLISAVSIKNSSNPAISWFQWLKLLEFSALYFYLSRYAFAKFGLISVFSAILAGGFLQAIIAIAQFLKQSSIGLKYLGESIINSDLLGIASFYLSDGEKIIRAYGTFPHPNVLAGYLFLVLCIMYYVLWKRYKTDTIYSILIVAYPFILFSFFLTFSRVGILAWAAAFLAGILIYHKSYPEEIKKIFVITVIVSGLFAILYWPEILGRLTVASDDDGLLVRKYYTEEVLKSDINFFGVGIGNFVNWLMEQNPMQTHWFYQPVHNIYLLIYSETGLLGLIAFVLFVLFLVKDFVKKTKLEKFSRFSVLVFFCSFLFIGFFDHFLWTLQQGRLMFWSSLGLLTPHLCEDLRLSRFSKERSSKGGRII